MTEILAVNDINQKIKLEIKFNLFDYKLSNILKSTLEVDSEYSKDIERNFYIDDNGNLSLEYISTAINIKPMKKSINAMYENMKLVLETVLKFSNM